MISIKGTIVKGTGPEIYVIEAGRRRCIPDPKTFMGCEYRWDDVRLITDQELKAIPLGPPLSSSILPYAEKQECLGNDHFMATKVILLPTIGCIKAMTQTWTQNFWLGFAGGVLIALVDEAGCVVGHTGIYTFAVDGLIVAGTPSARTDYWSQELPPTLAAQTQQLMIVHKTAPESRRAEIFAQLEQLAHEAAQSGRPAGSVALEMAAIVA